MTTTQPKQQLSFEQFLEYFVYLVDETGVYPATTYRGSDRIISRTFPELTLTVEQLLKFGYQ